MISSESYNNVKYYSKVVIILLVVFLLLRFMLDIKPYEAILLASIIAVSVLIIENIIFINNNASDPLNCDQCKVSVIDDNISSEKTNNTEPFIGNMGNHLNDLYNNVMEKVFSDNKNTTLPISGDNNYEYKCIKVQKNNSTDNFTPNLQTINANNDIYNNGAKTTDNNGNTNKDIVEGFEQFIENQEKQNNELKIIPIKSSSENNVYTPIMTEVKKELSTEQPIVKPETKPQGPSEVKPQGPSEVKPQGPSEVKPQGPSEVKPEKTATTSENLTYSVNYVQYQQDGLQQEADKQSAEINQFRRNIADQDAVTPWSKEGYKYYADIFARSVGAPPANEALTNELKYGDYNYVGPINKGMINKDYTFVSPSNWYPIPPHPPVCVTNKTCTTCPIQISDGKDYMSYASWNDFDQARRFTGDMGINVDYVKNVLNNPNGF
jgi:hypothetical protein